MMVGHHADGLQLLAGEHVRLVDGEDDVAAPLVGLGGERGLDLGDEVAVVEPGRLAQCGGQRPVQAPDPDLGVGEVDQGVAGGVEAVGGGAQRGGFPGADLAGQDADAAGGDQPAQAGDGFLVGGGGEQRGDGDGRGERHAGEAVVGLQVRDHDGSFGGGCQPLAVVMASATRAMLRRSRLPRQSRRETGVPSARLAAMSSTARSEPVQGR